MSSSSKNVEGGSTSRKSPRKRIKAENVKVQDSTDDLKKSQSNNHHSLQLLEDWISHKDAKYHHFDPEEAAEIRQALLTWYYEHRRKLPWRGDAPPYDGSTAGINNGNGNSGKKNNNAKSTKKKKTTTDNSTTTTNNQPVEQTAYGTWVSEIMLQQTRVEAVIPYWLKWMESFPTVQDLAEATEEQVNAHWAGLGFYRRARLLHQGAQYIVKTYDNGVFPQTVPELLAIPGVGPYTAGAIASIAFDVCTPVVDGNVCRVLSRLRGIANHIKAPVLKDKLAWDLAEQIVQAGDGSCAGDVNQALMELGATYCAPSGTGIDQNDPLKDYYVSTKLGLQYYEYSMIKAAATTSFNATRKRIDALMDASKPCTCELCDTSGVSSVLEQLAEALDDQVANAENKHDAARRCGHGVFPTSPPKLSKREEVLAVGAISAVGKNDKDIYWLLVKRPKKGLLAGQWEFPSVCVWNSSDKKNESANASSDDKIRVGTKRKASSSTTPKKKANQPVPVPVISASVRREALTGLLNDLFQPDSDTDLKLNKLKASPMEHIFSHVRHTMWVEWQQIDYLKIDSKGWTASNGSKEVRWLQESDMQELGITSGVKKILKAVKEEQENSSKKMTFFQPKTRK